MKSISKKILNSLCKGVSPNIDFKRQPYDYWIQFLKSLSQNRVLYTASKTLLSNPEKLTSKQISAIEKINSEGMNRQRMFQDTVDFLENSLGKENIPYLIVKTFKYLDYVTFDVDVLVPYERFKDTQRVLAKYGCEILSHPRKQGVHQRNCRKKGLLNIDLHRKFYWQGLEHIDLDFVWASSHKREINGTECPCPSIEVDLLLHLKQLAYERYYITYLDYLAISKMLDEVDKKLLLDQAQKFGWSNSLLYTFKLINQADGTNFPIFFSYAQVLKQFFETIIKQRKTTFFDLMYYHYTFLRYTLNRDRLPYYDHWFDFKLLEKTD